MADTWISDNCPVCKIRYWINLGNLDDFTIADVEALRCWSCKHEWLTLDDDDEPLSEKWIHDTRKLPDDI